MNSRKFTRVTSRTIPLAGALTLALGAVAGAAITIAPSANAAIALPTTTFTVPGPCQNFFTVPADIYNLHVVLVGGQGVTGGESNFASVSGGSGGHGAQVTADLKVRPGEQLNVNVGANGSDPTQLPGQQPLYIGGAIGGIETINAESFGGQGGGASDIDNQQGCGYSVPSSVLVMAGGGGGGGGGGTIRSGGSGGTAGHDLDGKNSKMNGGNGGGKLFHGNGGGGATTLAGGNGGGGGNDAGQNGSALAGGNGGVRTQPVSGKLSFFDGGGGGGGGWFGGGGGGEGAGGGGGGGGAGASVVLAGTADSIVPAPGTTPMVSITPMIVAPDAPTAVSAVASGPNQATITFTPPAIDGGSPVIGYTVYATAGDRSFNQSAGATGSPTVINNLAPGQTYTFTVTATSEAGEGAHSAPSNSVVAFRVPLAPTVTSATPGNGSATVAFNQNASDKKLGNPVTSYTVTARLGVNVTSGPGITVTGAGSPITITGLTNGQNYTVTVFATNAGGSGPESAGKVVFPQSVPGAPTNVTATNATPVGATTGMVNLTFNAPANTGGRPIRSYTAVSSPGGISVTAGAVTGSSTGSIQVTGLTIGTSYTFTVFATTQTGNGPASDPSNSVTPSPGGIPSPPLVPGASTLDQASFVSCLPPSNDGGSPIVSYTVTSSPGGITASGPSCPILVEGLTDGTAYTFTVTATNADGGTSQPSQPTAAITPHVPSGAPPANDDYANSQVITGASGSVTAADIGATLEPGEPGIQDTRGGASVWYTWTVPADGTYQFDTCSANPGFPTNIGLFVGSTVSSASEFGPGPSQDICPAGEAGSTIVFGPYSAGLTLHIKVDGQNELGANFNPAYEGVFTLEWTQLS
jgi:Fibronectin type III domain